MVGAKVSGGGNFVKKSGDTMTGNLNIGTNLLTFAADNKEQIKSNGTIFQFVTNAFVRAEIANDSFAPATDSAFDLGKDTPKYFRRAYIDDLVLQVKALDGSPVEGQLAYNSATNKLNFWNGSAWEVVTSV